MDNSNMSKNRPNEYLGVNKIGKNIKKSPLHQPNFASSNSSNNNNPARQQPQPQVYNISKTDFRSVVQQLTGSPLHSQQEPLPPRPPNNPPKHPSNRLQRIRPPPLRPINRPLIPNVVPVPPQPPVQPPMQGRPMAMAPGQVPYGNNFARPYQFGPPSPAGMPPLNPNWPTPALSPISAYMQQLQSCINDHDPTLMPSPSKPPLLAAPGQAPAPNQLRPREAGQFQSQPPSSILHNPPVLPYPPPTMNSSALLPSPNSQFLLPSPSLPSPSGFFNLLSPTARSPYPFPSPGSAFPPLSPNFSFPSMGQPGILGPGPQPPWSPNAFPLSPSMFFPGSSPRWRNP